LKKERKISIFANEIQKHNFSLKIWQSLN